MTATDHSTPLERTAAAMVHAYIYTSLSPLLARLWHGSLPCNEVAASLSISVQRDGLAFVKDGWLKLSLKGVELCRAQGAADEGTTFAQVLA